MTKIPVAILALLLAACVPTPEQRAAQLQAWQAQEKRLEVALAARCDRETARLIALEQQQWVGAGAEDRAQYAARIADPVFQSCLNMARENHHYRQRLQDMEELKWQLEMEYDRDWLMDRPFPRHPYGRWRW